MSKTATDKDVSNDFTSDIDTLKKSFSQLREDVSDLLSNAAGAGRSGANNMLGNVKHRLSDLRDRGAEQVESIEESIADHPVTSALILFGIGYITAHLLRRR